MPAATTRPAVTSTLPGFSDARLQSLPQPVLEIDRFGEVRRLNQAAVDLYSDRMPVGRSLSAAAIVTAGHASRLFAALRASAQRQEVESCEVHVMPTRGVVQRASISVQPQGDGLMMTLRMLEERPREEGPDADQVVQECLRAVPSPAFVCEGGRITSHNAAAAEWLGYRTLSGKSIATLVHAEDRRSLPQARALKTSKHDLRFITRGGDTINAKTSWRSIRSGGEVVQICVAEEHSSTVHTRARLAQSDRLSTVGVLAAGVAHEINNPLTYVTMNLGNILEGLRGASGREMEELIANAEKALEGVERVGRIVRDLRSFARDGDPVKPIDVADELRRALDMARSQLQYKARLRMRIEDTPAVRAAPGRLGQVFLNLLLNAAQAMPEGDPEENEIRVRCVLSSGEVVVTIQDTGPGMPDGVRAKVFEPFFTTKVDRGGSGLGLYICHQYVQECGGTIEVDSEVGFGTTFTVRVPAMPEHVRAESAPAPLLVLKGGSRSAKREAPRRLEVLVVEDEAMIREGLAAALRHLGTITQASGGEEAKALLQDNEANYDVIVCDLLMPRCSGPQLYEWMRRRRPDLCGRVGFITGGAFTDESRTFLEEIAPPLLHKPFTTQEVLSFCANLVGGERVISDR